VFDEEMNKWKVEGTVVCCNALSQNLATELRNTKSSGATNSVEVGARCETRNAVITIQMAYLQFNTNLLHNTSYLLLML
jgi:hypothetical protein